MSDVDEATARRRAGEIAMQRVHACAVVLLAGVDDPDSTMGMAIREWAHRARLGYLEGVENYRSWQVRAEVVAAVERAGLPAWPR